VNNQNHKPRVAFQGQPGAFSEEAAVKLLGEDIDLVPRRTFASLFTALKDGGADYLLAPVENSIAGVVHSSVDLLHASELVVVDEVAILVAQHLIACPGANFSDIEAVQSHPVALAQCTLFFANHPQLEQIESDDTAGSVAEIVARGDPKFAAVAGRRAAELYGGSIIRENIQDRAENYTRFVLLSPLAE
jgi:prephenate dehydratase